MNTHVDELAEQFRQLCGELSENEKHVLQRLKERVHVTRNTNQQFEDNLTFGQRFADKIAAFVGSWAFILLFGFVLFVWICLNTFILTRPGKAFDPYPYILLNLMLSMIAGLQGAILLIAARRADAISAAHAEHDYQTNIAAKKEVEELMEMHKKQLAQLNEVLVILKNQDKNSQSH